MNFKPKYILRGALVLSFFVLCEVPAFYAGYQVAKSNHDDAIEQCALDLDQGCPRLFEYAGMLEDENGHLNKELKKLKEQLNAR